MILVYANENGSTQAFMIPTDTDGFEDRIQRYADGH